MVVKRKNPAGQTHQHENPKGDPQALPAAEAENGPFQARLLHAIKAEQEKIARELHDSLSGLMTATQLQAHVLGQRLLKLSLHQQAAEAQEISERLATAIKNLRVLVTGLHPLGTGPYSFIDALQTLALRVRATRKMKCRVVAHCLSGLPAPECANQLYRIAEEAMHNALRHSQASHLTILFKQQARQWILRVTDNGCGFDPSTHNGGHGMLTMRHRARSVGGSLAINSRPGAGTKVICIAPFPEAAPPPPGRNSEMNGRRSANGNG